MTKNSVRHTPYLRNHTYDCHLVHKCKIISLEFIFFLIFFKSLIFWVVSLLLGCWVVKGLLLGCLHTFCVTICFIWYCINWPSFNIRHSFLLWCRFKETWKLEIHVLKILLLNLQKKRCLPCLTLKDQEYLDRADKNKTFHKEYLKEENMWKRITAIIAS